MVLTSRQLQIARLLAKGLTQRQVAERLGLHRRTIDAHVKAIREKAGFDSTREAVARIR